MPASPLTIDSLEPWIEVRFVRSSGPGGQNVNKLNTRVELLFDASRCRLLSPEEKARLRARLANRLSSDGRIRVAAQQARTQAANRRRAELRLLALLEEALHLPAARTPTRPGRGAVRRRIADKQRRSALKQLRRGPSTGE